MEWFSLLFGGKSQGLVDAALLIGLFWSALAHPGRIRNLWEFRLAALCLAVSLVVPTLIQVFLVGQRAPTGGRPGPGTEGLETVMYATAIPPVLTMLAIVLGVDSVAPRRGRGGVEPAVAQGAER